MSLPIAPVQLPAAVVPVQPASPGSAVGAGGAFSALLQEAIGGVQQSQQNSQNSIDKFLSGEDEEVHKVALATQQAELNFDLFLQVRNKVVAAYQEVMRMQL